MTTTLWPLLTPAQRSSAIRDLVDDLADVRHELGDETIAEREALIDLARMADAPVPVPPAPPGFEGQRAATLSTAADGAHRVTLALYRFADGSTVPYVEASEGHDGGRPGRVMSLGALVHLVQNASEEVWAIGGRSGADNDTEEPRGCCGEFETGSGDHGYDCLAFPHCETCGGSGNVPADVHECNHRDCPDCGGKGWKATAPTRRPLPAACAWSMYYHVGSLSHVDGRRIGEAVTNGRWVVWKDGVKNVPLSSGTCEGETETERYAAAQEAVEREAWRLGLLGEVGK